MSGVVRAVERGLVAPDASLAEALEAIENGSAKIALVVDGERRLLGTVTDGDIRRALIAGVSLTAPVRLVMSAEPVTASADASRRELLALMQQRGLVHLPLLDDAGRVVGVETLAEIVQPAPRPNPVVLMAGGRGIRLGALTKEQPKPLIRVGSKPILETVIDGLAAAGFWRFYISVNYRAAMLEEYFGDGSRWGVSIDYLRETTPLGTAGALSLLPESDLSTLVMNGDLLTRVDFSTVLDFHVQEGAAATMCVRPYESQIPFGSVVLDGNQITQIEEKPATRFLVNAGIYVLEPRVLRLVEPHAALDMTSLFDRAREQGLTTVAFRIGEYWMDIGRVEDLTQALLDVESGLLDGTRTTDG